MLETLKTIFVVQEKKTGDQGLLDPNKVRDYLI